VQALRIAVGDELRDRWAGWLAPVVQPFFVESVRPWPKTVPAGELTDELRHTYRVWRLDRRLRTVWLDEATFHGLDRPRRAALVREQVAHGRGAVPTVRRWAALVDRRAVVQQGDGHRFVWWPSLVATDPAAILGRVIDACPDGSAPEGTPSRHREVAASTWRRCAAVLPLAGELAGSFPTSSRPNCFSTVLAAAGLAGPDDFVVEAPFLAWLDGSCRPGGDDEAAGTVLVWREGGRAGRPVHAAVTIGEGWVLEKASGEWWTPRAVRTVADVVRSTRSTGLRLERHHLVRTPA
jgi:hypothetical protein